MEKSIYKTMDEYISQFPADIQDILQRIRKEIQAEAPEATEKMSYQMPTFYFQGNLVHFAAYKKHIGFYPSPSGIEAFKKDIVNYKWAKGSVQFPIKEPIPYELIRKIVRYRLNENKK